jgi:hypothetical protein
VQPLYVTGESKVGVGADRDGRRLTHPHERQRALWYLGNDVYHRQIRDAKQRRTSLHRGARQSVRLDDAPVERRSESEVVHGLPAAFQACDLVLRDAEQHEPSPGRAQDRRRARFIRGTLELRGATHSEQKVSLGGLERGAREAHKGLSGAHVVALDGRKLLDPAGGTGRH